MLRRTALLSVLLLLVAACSYESSGTTTTTLPLIEEEPVATGPADIVAADQRSEGSSVLVDSLSMPSAGWVIARLDSGGSPGEVIGISELVSKGVISGVPVPFLVPIAETTTVHLTVHIDMDGDGEFRYEAPDAFIDEIATEANGDPATTTVVITLLPPLSPGSALLDAQLSDGTSLVVAGGLLPAAGFLAVHQGEGGEPGTVLAVSDPLPAGEVGPFTLSFETPLSVTGLLFVVAWVDRDENGEFNPGEGGDEMAVNEEGSLAAASAIVTVIRREPATVVVADQVVENRTFIVTRVEAPAPAFLEVLADAAGTPGGRLAVVTVDQGTATELAVPLPAGVRTGARVWLRLWVDSDQSGDLSAADQRALSDLGGDPVQASFIATIAP
ncbi:MAG: hypothetical protein HZA58_03430 [Acidimicrobiia bacterium]|nr:hypothetical protein [Acidimicrobiia bacterium]